MTPTPTSRRPGKCCRSAAVTQPAGGTGTVTTDGTTVTFTPGGTFKTGSTSFTYTVSDGDGGTSVGNVTVTDSERRARRGQRHRDNAVPRACHVDVLANDTDANGDPLTVTAVTGQAHGTAVITGSGCEHEGALHAGDRVERRLTR